MAISGIIPLTSGTAVEQSSSRTKYENTFEITTLDRTFELQAPTYDVSAPAALHLTLELDFSSI